MNNQLGIIGQKYEDRLTKKCGVLVSRNEEHCSLLFEGADGKKFTVSNVTFKSKWHKVESADEVKTEDNRESEVETVVEQKTEKKVVRKADKKQVKESTLTSEEARFFRVNSYNDLIYVAKKFFPNAIVKADDFVVDINDKFGSVHISVDSGDALSITDVNGTTRTILYESVYAYFQNLKNNEKETA